MKRILVIALLLLSLGCLRVHKRCTHVDAYGYHKTECEWVDPDQR